MTDLKGALAEALASAFAVHAAALCGAILFGGAAFLTGRRARRPEANLRRDGSPDLPG